MSIQWEAEFREPVADDESGDVFQPMDNEDDYFACGECAVNPCLGDWFGMAF
jgi:hypothetical protein